MKVLLVHPGPEFSVADVFNGWHKALVKQGHDVMVYNTHDRLKFFQDAMTVNKDGKAQFMMSEEQSKLAAFEALGHYLYSFWPDIVIFISGFYIRAQMLNLVRSRGHKVVVVHTESPYQDDEQLMRAQYANLNILNDPANLSEYQHLAPSLYIPHAYDPDVHYPGTWPDRELDFTFIGSMFKSRIKFFERMFSELGEEWLSKHVVAFGGQNWQVKELDNSPLLRFLEHDREDAMDNTEAAGAYRDARVGINVYRVEGEDRHTGKGVAMGPREVEMAACGIPFLRDSRPESDEVFPFLPTFDGPEEAADLLKWYIDNPRKSELLGSEARCAIEDRTFDNNIRTMMAELFS
jgi:hypothetical protein